MTNWQDRITSDPNICHGRPCIKGTRVMVSVIIDNLAAGETHESIIRGYNVQEEDIQAALGYAADLARDRVVALPGRGRMMQFEIDENLHSDAADLLREHGHDAATVLEQGLRGESDADIASVCRKETRAIITLDLDFSDIRTYRPADYEGIIVFRLNDQSRTSTLQVLRRIIPLFDTQPLAARLWIVDEHQVRIRE